MPAERGEIDEAEHEGVKLHLLAAPSAIRGEKGRVVAIRCQRMKLGAFDASGRRRPVPEAGAEFDLPVDTVIVAIGQAVDTSAAGGSETLVGGGRFRTQKGQPLTGVPWVFAAGDCVTGADTVIAAIAAGKRAAAAIDRYLGGAGVLPRPQPPRREISGSLLEEETPRVPVPMMSIDRRQAFQQVELGYTGEQALAEARRCLRCDVREVGEEEEAK
jgi:NADH-quinone oxidoreductase subunit F